MFLSASATTNLDDVGVLFTLGQLLWVCGAILTISAVVAILVKVYKWLRTPENTQNEEIRNLQEHQKEQDSRMDKFEEYFKKDKDAIDNIEAGNKVVQQSILVLMNHAINGNDIDNLKEGRDRLEKYLIER